MNYDESQQIWLGLVLASLMFGVALELRLSHFLYVLRRPLPSSRARLRKWPKPSRHRKPSRPLRRK